jgi:hypothetical protein
MDPRQLFLDERHKGRCVYCGAEPDTRDHVPSRVLLDEPLPSELPVVPACSTCNAGFSLDEEYLACLVECAICGSAEPDAIQREKVRRSLERNAKLQTRIQSCSTTESGQLIWVPELERVKNVVVKLAQGHAAFELYPVFEPPDAVDIRPFVSMTDSEREAFDLPQHEGLQAWPEIGSRAFMRACVAFGEVHGLEEWIVVQPGRYRYAVEEQGGILVRLVLSEYLACTVGWE